MSIKSVFAKIMYGYKATSESYIAHLRNQGYSIGDGCKIYVPSKTTIDEPSFMIEIGKNVKITGAATILCHDASVYRLDEAAKNGGGHILALQELIKKQLLEIMYLLDGTQFYLWERMWVITLL